MTDFYSPVHTTDGMPSFPRLLCVSRDTRCDAGYHIRCAVRKDNPRIFFQYTVAGQGFCKDRHGEHALPPGIGFLAKSDDPEVSYGYPPGASEPWNFVFLDFVGQTAYSMVSQMVKRFGHVYELPVGCTILERLLSFHPYDGIGRFYSMSDGLRLIMDLLGALIEEKQVGRTDLSDHHLVRQAQHAIQSDISARVTVSGIAARLRVSREHLSRVFLRQAGLTPYQYILGCKMMTACGLLKSRSLSVKEVAAALGYETPSHFTRTFQRVLETTPADFRENGTVPRAVAVRDGKAHLVA